MESLGVSLRRAVGITDIACAAHVRSVDSDEEDGSFEDAPVVAASVFKAHIRSVDSDEVAGISEDDPVVAASVFKVIVALEFCRQVSAGEIEPSEMVRSSVADRTPGPTGLSIFADEAVVSLRDLATSMMAVSDNAATDILLDRVTVERVNQTARSLGATKTHVAYGIRGLLSTMTAEAGLQTWNDVLREDPLYERLQESSALRPEATTRTTPRDMTTLLSSIWTDSAGPPEACAEVRRLMGMQPSGRLGVGLPGAQVFAKSGSLLGAVRNEVGVAEFPRGERYAIAIFTRSPRTDFSVGAQIDRAIGEVANLLVKELQERPSRD